MSRRLAVIPALAGAIALVFAFELRTWHGRGTWTGDPKGKVLLATWLASELWLNPWLLCVAMAFLVVAVVWFLLGRRTTT